MAITSDIVRTYRKPRTVVRRLLSGPPREDRSLFHLMLACLLIFVAQWPRLSREAFLAPEISLEARLAGALFAWIFVAPLLAYGIAALSHLAARLAGGRGSFYGARVALFWVLLATTPLFLLTGLIAGFIGAGTGLTLVGLITAGTLFLLWLLALSEAEFGSAVASPGAAH